LTMFDSVLKRRPPVAPTLNVEPLNVELLDKFSAR
jgi:hypothetical protein